MLRPALTTIALLAVTGSTTSDPSVASFVYAFAATLGGLIAAGVGVPIPEELPIIGAGIWVSQNEEYGWPRWLILPVCIVGVVTSDGLLYGMGRYFGARILENRWVKRLLPPDKRDRIQGNFQKYGIWTLLFARFLPAIRSPIFITAGIMRLSVAKFLLADGIYAIPGVSALFFLSWWFGDQFRVVVEGAESKVQRLRPLIILLFIAVLVGVALYHFLRRPVSTGDPKELPILGDKVAAKVDTTMMMPPAPKTLVIKKETAPHSSPNGEAQTSRPQSEERH